MIYSIKTVAVTESMEKKMEAAQMKMVKVVLGVMLKGSMKSKYIWGIVEISRTGEELSGERLRRFGHVKRKVENYIG